MNSTGPEDKTVNERNPSSTTTEDPRYEADDEPSIPDEDYDNNSGIWVNLD